MLNYNDVKRDADRLTEYGYFSMANLPYAKEIVAALKRPHPDVAMVHGIGTYNVGQYIYIPKGRATVRSLVKRQLRESEASVIACQKAVETMKKAVECVAG